MIMKIIIETKTFKLLNLLLNSNYALDTQEICHHLNINKRNLYYELNKINDLLTSYQLPIVVNNRDSGFILEREQKQNIRKLLLDEDISLQFTKEERLCLIIINLVLHPDQTLDMLANILNTSRSTIIKDFKSVEEILKQQNLAITFNNKLGYQFTGRFADVISLYFSCFDYLDTYIINNCNSNLLMEIKAIEHQYDCELINNQSYALAYLLKENNKCLNYLLDGNELIPETLKVIKNRVVIDDNYNYDEIVDQLITNFEQISALKITDRDVLTQRLKKHFISSIYRFVNHISITNVLLDDLKNQYFDLFLIVKDAFNQLNLFEVSDDELAFIAIHFLAFINPEAQKQQYKVLVHCQSGLAGTNLLKNELLELLNQDVIIDTKASVEDYPKYDLVISTVPLDIDDYLLVSPILSEHDKVNILAAISNRNNLIPQIMSLAKKYMDEKTFVQFNNEVRKLRYTIKPDTYKLSYFDDNIKHFHNEYTYQDALYLAAKPLLATNAIDKAYLEEIIELIDELGEYMFVNDQVILAHASTKHCYNLNLSINFFDTPVKFKTKKAHCIILLACVDQTSHIPLINELRTLIKKDPQLLSLRKDDIDD